MRFTDGGSRTTNGGAGEGTEKVLWDVRLPCDAQAHVQCSGTLKMSRGGLRTRACATTCHRRSGRCSGCQQWWHLSVSRISYGEIVTIRVPYHLLLLSNDFERPKRVVTLQFPQVRFLSCRCGFQSLGGYWLPPVKTTRARRTSTRTLPGVRT